MSGSWIGPMPGSQFPGQPPCQMHSIVPTEALGSVNTHVPMAVQKTWSLYLYMACGLIRRKKWLNSVDPGYYHRPAKTTSTERKTQETIRLWEARPQLKCFYTILYYVYYRPFYCSSQGEGRIWSTTSCFEISIPGFWTPAPTFYCWFRMAQKCGLLFGDAEFSLHVKLTIHRIESWPRHCAQG